MIWLIQNNSTSYIKARDVIEKYREQDKISKTQYLPNYDYPNVIGRFLDREKNQIEEYIVYSSSEKDVKKQKDI